MKPKISSLKIALKLKGRVWQYKLSNRPQIDLSAAIWEANLSTHPFVIYLFGWSALYLFALCVCQHTRSRTWLSPALLTKGKSFVPQSKSKVRANCSRSCPPRLTHARIVFVLCVVFVDWGLHVCGVCVEVRS